MDMIDIILIAFFNTSFTVIVLLYFVNRAGERIAGLINDSMNDRNDQSDIIDAYIEFTDRGMFMYAKEDNEFIAQGASWEELNKNTLTRFPDLSFNVSTEDVKKAKEFK